jgi:EAL domain-containing protein (putative c-di-GMP-specific phosphodiesterase class I)
MRQDDNGDVLSAATVLIVDDSADNVALLERMLRRAHVGHVSSTTDPRRALGLYREVEPDLVLLDLQMPDMDGFAVLEELGRVIPIDSYRPVLVLTGDATCETKERALRAGANDFVTKPFDRTEVILRARNLLQTRALHGRLQRHNAVLEATVQEQAEHAARTQAEHRERIERITRVLACDELAMVFQPIVDLHTGFVVGMEALARFAGEPQRTPDLWFEEATGVGLAEELELAAVNAALVRLPELAADMYLSVNVCPATAVAPALDALLGGTSYDRIVLEITEHARVCDYDGLASALDRLRAKGVRVAVDDAGAGFASFQHILRLRPDIIKLDITLTRDIDIDPIRRALGLALVSFAAELNATIVAEGIESRQEMDALVALGVSCGQGYFLGRPANLPPASAPPSRQAAQVS